MSEPHAVPAVVDAPVPIGFVLSSRDVGRAANRCGVFDRLLCDPVIMLVTAATNHSDRFMLDSNLGKHCVDEAAYVSVVCGRSLLVSDVHQLIHDMSLS